MSQENVEIVRRFFEDYRRGDFDTALECLAPDVVYKVTQEAPAHGPEAVRAIWERWEGAWEDLETVDEDYVDAGDQVVVTVRYSGRGAGSGVEFDQKSFEVYELRDGRCVRKTEYADRAEALAAAGVSE
jgi:ketosteroid isomerase-like protein